MANVYKSINEGFLRKYGDLDVASKKALKESVEKEKTEVAEAKEAEKLTGNAAKLKKAFPELNFGKSELKEDLKEDKIEELKIKIHDNPEAAALVKHILEILEECEDCKEEAEEEEEEAEEETEETEEKAEEEEAEGEESNKTEIIKEDWDDEAEIRKQLDKYSGRYLTITFKGSNNWKHISDLLEEYNDGDEEEAESALDELESSYRKEYDLLKSLEVDEISEITVKDRDVVVTIKVKKDDLQHNFSDHYSDLINMPSINKDTIKILELELNESLKRKYKKFSLKESTSKEKTIKEDLAQDLTRYQKWVDYDMKKYGRISDITKRALEKASLELVKDDHGDYEVIAKEDDGKAIAESVAKRGGIGKRK